MPRSRLAYRLSLLADRDALHSLAVAALACVASLGVVYLGYLAHVFRIARRAPCEPACGETVLLFGKHAPGGRPDPDFQARLWRAATLWRERPPRSMLLLGGGPAGAPSEARLAREHLLLLGVPSDAPLVLEERSRDTLQNLRNARALWRDGAAPATVTLLSSRYHLARCALLAERLGLHWELCAAEPAFAWRPAVLWRLAAEAAYVCWVDLGARWARLIGHQRMLARLG
jgi:vancomycin permeability regulator SanA